MCGPACINLSGVEIPRCLKERQLSNSYKTRICLQSFHSQAYEKKMHFSLTLVSRMTQLISVDSLEVFFCYFDQAVSSEIFQALSVHRIQ